MGGRRAYGSGSKREIRPGVWQVRFGGRARNIKGTAKDAERVLAQMITTGPGRPVAASQTIAELLDEWQQTARLESSSRYTVAGALKHLPESFGRKRIDRVTLADFDRLYADLEHRKVSVHQIHKLHGALSAAFTQAVRWGRVSSHPVRGALLPKLPDRKVSPPSKAQIDLLLAEAAKDIQTHTWLRLAVMTGARRGEVLALRWSDIDFDAGAVRFDESLRLDRSAKSTKTGRVRVVQVDDLTVALLRRWRAAQKERAMAAGVAVVPDAWVLSSSVDSSEPWRPDYGTYLFRRLCAATGVKDVRLHDLRHAMASQLLEAGVSPVTVAGRLGHASTTTTLRVYSHVIAGADRAAADTLAAIIDG